LEYPQYTRPEEFMGEKIPEVLLSGHHKNIEKWKHEKSLEITAKKRPELLKTASLTAEDIEYLKNFDINM
jgi:tRNA (guanine37-N1)-methyltransferase